MISYINDIGLSADEIDRVEELHKRFAFVVYNTGFSCTMEDDRKVEMCYWQNLRGVRQSALFPGHAAAWRDALRVHDEAVDAVKANPGVTRVARMPLAEEAELNHLKRALIGAGYSFSETKAKVKGVFQTEHFWKHNNMSVGVFSSAALAIRDAVKHWAKFDSEAFIECMNKMSRGEMPSSIHDDKPMPTFTVGARNFLPPLSAAELAELQGFPGYDEMPEEHKQLTAQAQQILKLMQIKGITLDLSKLAGTVEEAACVAYKSQGKSFEEVEDDQRNAKRVYGLVEGSPEEKQIRHLEAIGYEFFFTSTSGWVCKQIDRTVASGALMSVVKVAWEMAVSENGAAWQGVGQPPVGTTLWVTPHNTLWGFDLVDHYLCEVLAYHNDFVWLQLLSDTGEVVLGKYVTTRIDKVDVKVWKGNQDA